MKRRIGQVALVLGGLLVLAAGIGFSAQAVTTFPDALAYARASACRVGAVDTSGCLQEMHAFVLFPEKESGRNPKRFVDLVLADGTWPPKVEITEDLYNVARPDVSANVWLWHGSVVRVQIESVTSGTDHEPTHALAYDAEEGALGLFTGMTLLTWAALRYRRWRTSNLVPDLEHGPVTFRPFPSWASRLALFVGLSIPTVIAGSTEWMQGHIPFWLGIAIAVAGPLTAIIWIGIARTNKLVFSTDGIERWQRQRGVQIVWGEVQGIRRTRTRWNYHLTEPPHTEIALASGAGITVSTYFQFTAENEGIRGLVDRYSAL